MNSCIILEFPGQDPIALRAFEAPTGWTRGLRSVATDCDGERPIPFSLRSSVAYVIGLRYGEEFRKLLGSICFAGMAASEIFRAAPFPSAAPSNTRLICRRAVRYAAWELQAKVGAENEHRAVVRVCTNTACKRQGSRQPT